MQTTVIHPFEKAGLGQAPFQLIGCQQNWYVTDGGRHKQPGGTCDYCGTGILYEFVIKSADGKEFVVGSDCVAKTGDAGLSTKVNNAKKTLVKQAKEQARNLKNVEKIKLGIMPFGKHQFEKIADVAEKDVEYLVWMYKATTPNDDVSKALLEAVTPYAKPIVDARELADRLAREAAEDLKALSNHLGTVGEKITVTATLEKSVYFAPRFYNAAGSNLLIFRDTDNNIITAYYSGSERYEKGLTYTFKGTVKAHTVYENTNQTQLTRIKQV